MKKLKLIAFSLAAASIFSLTGCTQELRREFSESWGEGAAATREAQIEANSFQRIRRLVVYNTRTNEPIYQIKGCISISNSSDELCVTCKVADDDYRLHYIYLTENVAYIVEDINDEPLDLNKYNPYHYEIEYFPDVIPPESEG